MANNSQKYILTILRVSTGWIFLWSFFDKLFGLGFSTVSDNAWITGTSPTLGFLKFGTYGPFSSIFQGLAGSIIIDWLFMMGLLLIGLCLILGVMVRIVGYAGALIMLLIWLAILPPEHNPFLDNHIIYILVLILLAVTNSSELFGLGRWWSNNALVKKYPFLQ